MVIREAKADGWAAIWLILQQEGSAGETLTWDPDRTEARARADGYRAMQFDAVAETSTRTIRNETGSCMNSGTKYSGGERLVGGTPRQGMICERGSRRWSAASIR